VRVIDVTPIEIKDFAASFGWTLVRDALDEGLFVLNSPNKDNTQLILPKDEESPFFEEMANVSLEWLSKFLNKPIMKVIEEIREVNDDVISLRYHSESKKVNSISFEEALDAIESTRQMLLSAASSIVSPKLYHPKLIRTEPLSLVKKARFRHTEEGSFILKISCPVDLEINPNPGLFGNDLIKPLSRKTFELINSSSTKILKAIEDDSMSDLYQKERNSDRPELSYNFCDSLSHLFDDERELPFELIFNWSRAHLEKLPTPQLPNRARFPYSFKSKLDQLKGYFRPPVKIVTDTFVGTVEALLGNESDDVRRSGDVLLSLLVESKIITARVNLDVDQYDLAIKAHKDVGTYITLEGRLGEGTRVRTIEDLRSFKIIQ
jgi:hypothetical protein